MTALLEISSVGMEYKVRHGLFRTFHHTALSDISFTIEQGETLGVIGRNGSGKSTLLELLTGLIRPTSGTIRSPLGAVTRSLLTLGLGFRTDLSGEDNVIVSLVLQGYSRKSARQLVPKISEFAELGPFFYEPVRTYSAGMRARLGFATGTHSNVDLLLIDEVLGVGDIEFRDKAEATMIERMGSEQTVVFVTQAPQQAARLCNRVLWLEQGNIRELGDAKEVANNYQQASRPSTAAKEQSARR